MENNPGTGKERAEKESAWESTTADIEKITDKLGKKIDAGIKDTIVGLKLCGIHTTGSCEGHADNRGTGAPYIDVESENIEKLEDDLKTVKNESEARLIVDIISKENLAEQEKFVALLEEFYKDRQSSYRVRLSIQNRARNRSRLESQGTALQKVEQDGSRKKHLEEYQAEMRAFSEFLKNKFLGT